MLKRFVLAYHGPKSDLSDDLMLIKRIFGSRVLDDSLVYAVVVECGDSPAGELLAPLADWSAVLVDHLFRIDMPICPARIPG